MSTDERRRPPSQEFSDKDRDDLAHLLSPTADVAALMLLKGYLLVENWMDRFIEFLNSREPRQVDARAVRCLSPTAQKLLCRSEPWSIPTDMSYYGKLRFLTQSGLIPEASALALERLSRIRNSFAHDFRKTVTHRDVRFILEPLLEDETTCELYQETAHASSDVASHLRFALLQLLMQLFLFLGGLSKLDDVLAMFQDTRAERA